MRKLPVVFPLLLLAVFVVPAHAQYSGYYVEVAGGSVDTSFEVFQDFSESSGSDNAARLTVGYKFNDNVSVEASYVDYGDFSTQVTGDVALPDPGSPGNFVITSLTLDNEFSISSFGLGVVGMWPLGRHFEVYGKAALHQWDLEVEFFNPQTGVGLAGEDDGSGISLGAGIAWNPTLSFSIRLEYEMNDLSSGVIADEFEVEGTSVGLRYYF